MMSAVVSLVMILKGQDLDNTPLKVGCENLTFKGCS